MTTHRSRGVRSVALMLGLAVVAAACGGDDDAGDASGDTGAAETTAAADGTTGPEETPAPDGTDAADATTAPVGTDASAGTAVAGGEGCGEEAVTDPANRSSDRPIAHCEPGFPEPQPLNEPTTIRLGAATKGEYLAPVLLAQELGEFEKENLEVEIVTLAFSDSVLQMANGKIDAANGGPFASYMNAVGGDINVKWVLGNYSPADGGNLDVPQSGLWTARDAFSDPENPDLSELSGKSIANSLGLGTVAVYWLAEIFEEAGVDFQDVSFETIPPADQLVALEGGAVAGGFMLDPYWKEAADQPDKFKLVGTQPREPNGGIFFGPNLLDGDPAAGDAFTRAYIRTINTYLQPGYQDDQEVVDTLAEAIPVEPQLLIDSPELAFEWEIREGVVEDVQEVFIDVGVQEVPAMDDAALVDRSFYLRAVGAE